MNTLIINATEFSRGLSEFLNKVQYTGQILDIERGKRVIARVSPAPDPAGITGDSPAVEDITRPSPVSALNAGFPIAHLDDLLAKGAIPSDERLAMAQDLRAIRSGLAAKADPWG